MYKTLDRIVSVNKGLSENAQQNIARAKIRLGLINKLLSTRFLTAHVNKLGGRTVL